MRLFYLLCLLLSGVARRDKKIAGREVTPYLLKQINKLTAGESLKSSAWPHHSHTDTRLVNNTNTRTLARHSL